MSSLVLAVALMMSTLALEATAFAQSAATPDARVMSTVREAIAPALPYPATDETGELPADGLPTAQWMVRPLRDGEQTIEVLANPLNASNQARATRAMVQIEAAIEAAQRRSQASYEKAVTDAQRTGRSQDIDGISLTDEGVAGARIDAEAHVTIDVAFNQPSYSFGLRSSVEPAPLATPVAGAVGAVSVPANVYRDGRDAAGEHYGTAETHVFFGAIGVPEVDKRSATSFEVKATATAPGGNPGTLATVVVSLRGNAQLIDQIVRQADWTRVQSLLRAP